MKKISPIILPLLLLTVMASCRKEPLELNNPAQIYCKTYVQQFEALWHGMDQSYLFWDIDTIDWDARYTECLPLFQALDSRGDAVTQEEYQQACEQLFRGLTDHHLQMRVKSPRNEGLRVTFSPSSEELHNRSGYHSGWDERSLEFSALKNMDGVLQYAIWDDDDRHTSIRSAFALIEGREGRKIAYFRFNSFDLYSMWENRDKIKKNALEPIKKFYGSDFGNGIHFDGTYGWAGSPDVEAVIIDLRGNGGGYVRDVTPFIGSLLQQDYHWGYSRVKEGIGRLDYSAWTEYWIKAHGNHIADGKRIVVLADCNSASCSEISTQTLKGQPNGTFIGERTCGATCPLVDISQDMFYSGIFGDENLSSLNYYVYTSYMYCVGQDRQSFEGRGITPDIEVPFDRAALDRGHDTQLERAVAFLKE